MSDIVVGGKMPLSWPPMPMPTPMPMPMSPQPPTRSRLVQ